MRHEDTESIWANMQHEEKKLQQKRMVLMGLSDIDSLDDKKGTSHARNCDFIPESFMRKDDVFYEDVKKLVEECFGVWIADTMPQVAQDDVEFCNFRLMSKVILGLLDDLSNNGLCHLANIVNEDSVTINRTRPCMKKAIKESLGVLQSKQSPSNQAKIQSQVSQLLKNQKNFRQNHVGHFTVTLKTHESAIMKVLDGLEDMPTHALNAMHRKLKGICGNRPQLCPARSGWNRDRLIDQIRNLCREMICKLDKCDELPAPFAEAMNVAGLSSKMKSNYEDLFVTKFIHLIPELEDLQHEMFKAISLLGQRLSTEKLKKVHRLLDPTCKVDGKAVKAAIKNFLIMFLYECVDISTVPKSLTDALCIINNASSSRPSLKEKIEQEVECILNMGSSMKQILLDYIPNDTLDQDFADAYMEELEESDDGDIFDDDDVGMHMSAIPMREVQVGIIDLDEEVQSTTYSEEVSSSLSLDVLEDTNESSNPPQGEEMLIPASVGGNSAVGDDMQIQDVTLCSEQNQVSVHQKNNRNKYLELQEDTNESSNPPQGEEMLIPASVGGNLAVGDDMQIQDVTLCLEQNQVAVHQRNSRNKYLELQEVSDQASLVAHGLIGHLMVELANMDESSLDHDNIVYLTGKRSMPKKFQDPDATSMGKDARSIAVLRAVEKVIPSFSSSDLEELKKILDS